MNRESAGLLLYKRTEDGLAVFLVHPGGPFWRNKDEGAWTIPKGLVELEEDRLAAARREFAEETGFAPEGDVLSLGAFLQPGGKVVYVWAVAGDADPAKLASNFFEMEWPPRSGRRARFPEADRAGWFGLAEARAKILKGQRPVVETLCARLGLAMPSPDAA